MGKIFETIDSDLADWIKEQRLFFVATAALAADTHLNCSPKGADSFRLLSPSSVAYLDRTGSGAETIAHVRENQRIVLMFCAMTGSARIVRLHGLARVVEPHDTEFAQLADQFDDHTAVRSIIVTDLNRISDSCGWGVPTYEYKGERDVFRKYAISRGPEGLAAYRAEKNQISIDGLPALRKT